MFIPKKILERQEKLRLIREKELKELNELSVKLSNIILTFKDLKIDNEAESFFIKKFIDCQIKIDQDKYSNMIFFFDQNNNYLSEYSSKNQEFWISYQNIWTNLVSKYSLKGYQIKNLSKTWVEEHFKLRPVTTHPVLGSCSVQVKEHFKLRPVTTVVERAYSIKKVEEHFKLRPVTTKGVHCERPLG